MYRKDEAGDKARQKVMDSKLTQAVVGPGQGLYTTVRRTAETISALSDLYLDTETLEEFCSEGAIFWKNSDLMYG